MALMLLALVVAPTHSCTPDGCGGDQERFCCRGGSCCGREAERRHAYRLSGFGEHVDVWWVEDRPSKPALLCQVGCSSLFPSKTFSPPAVGGVRSFATQPGRLRGKPAAPGPGATRPAWRPAGKRVLPPTNHGASSPENAAASPEAPPFLRRQIKGGKACCVVRDRSLEQIV